MNFQRFILKGFFRWKVFREGKSSKGWFLFYFFRLSRRYSLSLSSMVVSKVPLKGGIGGIVHPPIGRKNITYIAFSGVICYLPPVTGTRNNHWYHEFHLQNSGIRKPAVDHLVEDPFGWWCDVCEWKHRTLEGYKSNHFQRASQDRQFPEMIGYLVCR